MLDMIVSLQVLRLWNSGHGYPVAGNDRRFK
jgi:hypothetical protein